MTIILLDTLRRLRGQVIGWGLALFGLGLMLIPFYSTLADQADQFKELLESYPPEMMAFFGDMSTFTTPEGYLSMEYFSYMPLLLGIFALLVGSGLLVSDEEKGTLDLILAHPVSRSQLFWGRVGGFSLATFAIIAIGYLGMLLPLPGSGLGVSPLQLAAPFLALYLVILFFGSLGILLGFVLPSRKMAASVTAFVVVYSFFVMGFASLNQDIEPLAKLSPLNYYQSGDAINGLNWQYLGAMLTASVVLLMGAWQLFLQRDIRVMGEGKFSLPFGRQ